MRRVGRVSGVDEAMYNAYRNHLNNILDMSLLDLLVSLSEPIISKLTVETIK